MSREIDMPATPWVRINSAAASMMMSRLDKWSDTRHSLVVVVLDAMTRRLPVGAQGQEIRSCTVRETFSCG